MKNSILKDKELSLLSKLILIGLWALLSSLIDKEVILPSIKSTILSLIDIVKDPSFFGIIFYSLFRSIIGFAISLAIAMALGIISSSSKFLYNLMLPILNFLSSVPTMAIIILALIWLNNELVPMFVGFLMVFPILYETVLKAILNIDKEIIEMAKLYKVDRLTIIRDIYIPSIFINLSSVLTSAININLKMVIAGEVLGQPRLGIGSNLQMEKMYLNTSGVFAWIIIILIISKLLGTIGKFINSFTKEDEWK